jgi:triacylglycerol esterase/lipase EstA (alpha/beta hydrolase family)
MWLRDKLPQDVPGVRSIIYGYDTQLVMSESVQTIDDLALSFIQRLSSIGQSFVSAKPLVFLAHSLGGILLKSALVEMANGNDKETFMLDLVRQIVFFGVPNQGMKTSHLRSMVEGQPNLELVETLTVGSTYLNNLTERFTGVSRLRVMRIISAYETKKSPTTKVI